MANPSSKLNLINDSAMVNGARKLYNAIRKYAPYRKIKDSVYITRVEGRGGSRFISVGINMDEGTGAPYARAFDTGSGIHSKRARKYRIVPRNAPFLQFEGTNEYAGKLIRTPEVWHPGVAGTNYTARAIKEVRPKIREDIVTEAKKSIRLYLKAEFTKFRK